MRELDTQRLQTASVSRVVKAFAPASSTVGGRGNSLRHSTGTLSPKQNAVGAGYYNYNFNNANRINSTAAYAGANGLVGVAGLSDATVSTVFRGIEICVMLTCL
jgi:hypothetical protein